MPMKTPQTKGKVLAETAEARRLDEARVGGSLLKKCFKKIDGSDLCGSQLFSASAPRRIGLRRSKPRILLLHPQSEREEGACNIFESAPQINIEEVTH